MKHDVKDIVLFIRSEISVAFLLYQHRQQSKATDSLVSFTFDASVEKDGCAGLRRSILDQKLKEMSDQLLLVTSIRVS